MVPLHRDVIARMYQNGASMAALAREFDTNRMTIRMLLVEEGVAIRPATNGVGGPPDPRVQEVLARHGDEIVAGYTDGLSLQLLSRAYGISASRIRHHLAERRVPRRTLAQAQALRRAYGR